MATTKKEKQQPIIKPQEKNILSSKEDRKEKPGGQNYWLKKEMDNPGHRQPFLPDRTNFVECMDGWFVIYTDGHKTPFRISPEKIESIKESLA